MNEHAISQLLTFAVFAIIAISRAVASAKRKSPDQSPSRPLTRAERPPADTETERQRRFREALGLPPDSTTPPPVRPRPARPAQGPLPNVTFPRNPTNPNQVRRIYTGVPHKAGAPAQPAPMAAPPAPVAPPPMRDPAPVASAYDPEQQATVVSVLQSRLASRAQPSAASAPAPTRSSSSDLLARLRDPSSIRQAIILREVLGPPKALQPAFALAGSQWSAH